MHVTAMSDIAWTDELRARVYPSRAFQNPTYRETILENVDLKWPIDPKAARKSAAYYWKDKGDLAHVKTGLAKNPPAWRPAVEQALARGKKPNAEHALDVDVEAATVTLELCPLFAALPYWLTAGGIPFALRALIRCHEIACSAAAHGYGEGLWILETRDYSYDRPEDSADAWELVRAMLADAIEPVYDEAHGIADEARLRTAGGTPNQSALQLLIAFAFPDETAWAKAAHKPAIGLAKQAKRGYTAALARYVAVAPVDTAVELLTCTINTAVSANDLLTALAHHGAAGGLRIFEAALAAATTDEDRRQFGADLLAIRLPGTAKVLAKLARRRKGGKVFKALAKQVKR
jgi:hypothetical protein